MSKEAKILTAVLVVVVGAMITLFVIANQSAPAPVGDKTKIIRDNSHKEGTGAVQLVEFGDYQCPACGAAYPNVKQLLANYSGKITFYFRNFPLTSIHQNALDGAEAAEAAGDQGKYWQMHDKLYESQKDWSELSDPTDTLVGYAKGLGLDTTKFKQALTSKQFQSVIDQDLADGNALSIQGTPTFYFNGVQYTGASTYEALSAQADSLLKK